MIKISNKSIIDVVRYNDDKVIIVEKNPVIDSINQYKASYFVINFRTGQKEAITKSAYLFTKFGSGYKEISEKLANFIQCDAAILPNRSVLVVSPNAQVGIFNSSGEIKWTGELKYNDSEVSGLALDDGYFWGYCKSENCVIRYSCDNLKVDLRIGSKEAETFVNPNAISADRDCIYICCNYEKVRKINKNDFSVSDVKGKITGVEGFYKFGEYSLISTSDGAYLDKD